MKKVTKNKLKMYNQVIAVCTLHQPSWGFVPTFETQFDVFRNDHTALLARLDLHGAQLSGHTRNKKEAQQIVVGKAYTFMNALCVHAELSGDFVLLARNNMPHSALRIGGMEALIARLNTLKQDAETHITSLGAMGLTTTDLDDLNAAIAAFKVSVTEPRQAILRRKQLTREIQEIQQRLDDQLKDKIDRLMVLMKRFDPEFNRLYKDARILIDYKSRSAQINIEPPDDESK